MVAGGVMRDIDEIVRAHDMLLGIVLDPVLRETFKVAGLEQMVVNYLDVLCWLLHHDHNQIFAKNMADIEAGMVEAGYVMEDTEKERIQ